MEMNYAEGTNPAGWQAYSNSPSVPSRSCVPPWITGPLRSLLRAICMEEVPVREYPAPMTWTVRDESVGTE